jgi:hypothetical protein
MNTTELNWRLWLEHGDKYLKAATPKGTTSKLGRDVRYNLLSMSLESYVMAILDFHNTMPYNHTYTDLIFALEKVIPVDHNLKARILQYENIQSICSVEKYHRSTPSEDNLSDLKKAVNEIGILAHKSTR